MNLTAKIAIVAAASVIPLAVAAPAGAAVARPAACFTEIKVSDPLLSSHDTLTILRDSCGTLYHFRAEGDCISGVHYGASVDRPGQKSVAECGARAWLSWGYAQKRGSGRWIYHEKHSIVEQ